MATLRIAPRFCGPDGTANGGYLAGSLAACGLGVAMRVRLNAPIPLATDFEVLARGDGQRELLQGGQLLASAQPAELEQRAPAAPDFAAAMRASSRFVGHICQAYPNCFVCGHARAAGDGLRILAGRTDDGTMVAAHWVPHESIADDTGRVPLRMIWAAIDCPGYFAVRDDNQPMLLGEITARVDGEVYVGEQCVVIGWLERVDGRKHTVGTALFNSAGRQMAAARALWITPRPAPPPA
jgi:hypothetical protein